MTNPNVKTKPATALPWEAEAAYWAWHHSEPLADCCVDAENVAPGENYWQRMIAAGEQAVTDRKEESGQ